MEKLQGMEGLIKLNDFLKSLDLDAGHLTIQQMVNIKSDVENALLNNDEVLKLIK